MARLLDAGEMPFEQSATHRRLRLADVLAYRERARRARAACLDQMVPDSEDDGFHDLPMDVPIERL